MSQECESSIKRLINLEARRQSCPCSWSSAWDREERSESERQRERKLNGKWSELEWKTRGGFWMKDNLSRLSLLNLYCFLPHVLYLPPEKVLDPFLFNLLWWLVWIKKCLVLFFLCLMNYSSVQTVIKWLMAALCEWQCEGERCHSSLSPARWPLKAPFKSNILKVHSKRLLLTESSPVGAPFGHLCISTERKGYLHSVLSSGTITAHLIPNWSCRDEIRHGECSWTLTVMTAVDVLISALYLVCLMRVVTCTAKKEASPPTHTYTHTDLNTHKQSSECQPSWTSVCFETQS